MQDAPRPLQQHPHFAACLRAAGRDVVELDAGLIVRRRISGVQVALGSRGAPALLDPLRQLGCVALFTPDRPGDAALSASGLVPLFTPARVAEWNISPAPDQLRKGLSGAWRNQLRKAESAKIKYTVTAAPRRDDHWLFKLDKQQMRQKRYRAMPHWIATAWAQLHPRDAVLFEARESGLPIAGMLFLRHGPVATYQIAFASGVARRLNTHRALMWRAMLHFRDAGVERLDLGTLETDRAPGLARFKLGTGARARALGGTWMSAPLVSTALRRLRLPSPSGQNA